MIVTDMSKKTNHRKMLDVAYIDFIFFSDVSPLQK